MTDKTEYTHELTKNICLLLKKKYIDNPKIDGEVVSANTYAKAVELTASTITKIAKGEGYNIPVSTIALITKFENSNLIEFFSELETFSEGNAEK